jgi:ribonuclease G
MPMNRYVGVSSRINDEKERERMRETGREIAGNRAGIVMREAALKAEREQIAAEADALLKSWAETEEKIREGFENGTVLYHQDSVSQMIADYEARGLSGIVEAETLPADLQRQLREARERTVRLRNGGNVIIDRCEAMTVIDVNSGSAKSDGRIASAYLETNLSACETIAAQIRLRNLAGIILIDFIDMESDADREKVAGKLKEALAADRRKTVIHGWTKLGLMEMTRKRTGI